MTKTPSSASPSLYEDKRIISMPVRYLINIVAIAVFMLIGNLIISEGIKNRTYTTILLQVGVYIILAVSLNISTGYLGQLPLGHAGFMAVGAYVGALAWKAMPHGLGYMIIGLIVAGIAAGIVGIIIGIPALRLRGDYLAILTLGFGEIIRIIIINLPDITGGTPGLLNIPKYSNFNVIFIFVILTCYIIHTMMKSRHGRAILSIRENEIAAEACGINTTYYKVMAFSVSAALAGVAGCLYGGLQGSLFPSAFGFMDSINILVMVVLGGMGSMIGSVLAASVLTALPAMLQFLASYRMVIYSVLLILVMIFKPSGLMGTYDFSLTGLIEKAIIKIRGGSKNNAKEGQANE